MDHALCLGHKGRAVKGIMLFPRLQDADGSERLRWSIGETRETWPLPAPCPDLQIKHYASIRVCVAAWPSSSGLHSRLT